MARLLTLFNRRGWSPADPGTTTYAVVSPGRAFRTQTHWIVWLASQSLKPRSEVV